MNEKKEVAEKPGINDGTTETDYADIIDFWLEEKTDTRPGEQPVMSISQR